MAQNSKIDLTVFEEVEHMSLAQRAAASMREAILAGDLPPGSQLVEGDIADHMNVSRAPVREAMRTLEEEGLVERIPYKGTFVTHITKDDIREVYSLRAVIEAFSVRLATERATLEDIRKLRDIVDEMRRVAKQNDLDSVTALDLKFHHAICEIARHKLLLQFWRGVEQKVRLILAMRHRLHREISEVVEMHEPLLEALRKGDSETAVQCMTDHIVASGEFIVEDWPEY